MSRVRALHPKIWCDEAFVALPVEARLLLIAVGTYSDYSNRLRVGDMVALADHCGPAWSAEAWDRLVQDGLVTIEGETATINFTFGHSRLRVSRWEAIRSAVFERDGYTCQYCGDQPRTLHCDHIHPKSRGGSDEMDNLVTACGPCNMSKGDRTLSEWVRNVQ